MLFHMDSEDALKLFTVASKKPSAMTSIHSLLLLYKLTHLSLLLLVNTCATLSTWSSVCTFAQQFQLDLPF